MMTTTIKVDTPYGEFPVEVKFEMNSGYPEHPDREFAEIHSFSVDMSSYEYDAGWISEPTEVRRPVYAYVADAIQGELDAHLEGNSEMY